MSTETPCSVLVVDDEVLVLELLAEAVIRAGYRALTAAGETEALTILAQAADGLAGLITDINLGEGDGWSVAVQARRRRPDLPVVYVTGDSAHEFRARGLPGSLMLTKPVSPARVAAALAFVVAAARQTSGR